MFHIYLGKSHRLRSAGEFSVFFENMWKINNTYIRQKKAYRHMGDSVSYVIPDFLAPGKVI